MTKIKLDEKLEYMELESILESNFFTSPIRSQYLKEIKKRLFLLTLSDQADQLLVGGIAIAYGVVSNE